MQFVELAEGLTATQLLSAADTTMLLAVTPSDYASVLLHDLRPFIEADMTFRQDDYYPGVLEPIGPEQRIYALPAMLNAPLLHYNKAIWSQAGLPTPQPDWTWADFLQITEALANTQRGPEHVYGMVDEGPGMISLLAALASSGSDVFIDYAQPQLDRPEVVRALERVAQLITTGAVYTRDQESAGEGERHRIEQLIQAGRVAMWPSYMYSFEHNNTTTPLAIGTLPNPALSILTLARSVNYVMHSGTQEPNAAWRWISFLSQQEFAPSTGTIHLVNQIPARRSIATQKEAYQRLDAEVTAARAAILNQLANGFTGKLNTTHMTLLGEALGQMTFAGITAPQAVDTAQQSLEEFLVQAQQEVPLATAVPVVPSPLATTSAAPGATQITFAIPNSAMYDHWRALIHTFQQQQTDSIVQLACSLWMQAVYRLQPQQPKPTASPGIRRCLRLS